MSVERNTRLAHAHHELLRFALARIEARDAHDFKRLHFLSLPATHTAARCGLEEKLFGSDPQRAGALVDLVERLRDSVDDVIHERGFRDAYAVAHAVDTILLRIWRRHFPEGDPPITGHVNKRSSDAAELEGASKTERVMQMRKMWENGEHWNY